MGAKAVYRKFGKKNGKATSRHIIIYIGNVSKSKCTMTRHPPPPPLYCTMAMHFHTGCIPLYAMCMFNYSSINSHKLRLSAVLQVLQRTHASCEAGPSEVFHRKIQFYYIIIFYYAEFEDAENGNVISILKIHAAEIAVM